jgi:DHA1 family multidrug resistance protein-like MFS transporter
MPIWKRTLYIIVVVQLMSALGFSSSVPFLSLYISELNSQFGLSHDLLVGLAFSAQAFTMMLIAPVWGALADRKGRKLMVMRAAFGSAILVALMGFVHSAEQLVALRMIQGLLTGVSPALAALVASTAPREKSGYAMGMLQMAVWGGVSLGPLMGGVIADHFDYQVTFLVTAFLLTGSGLLVWLALEENVPVHDEEERRSSLVMEWRSVVSLPGVPATYSLRSLTWISQSMMTPFIPLVIAALMIDSNRVATVTGLITGAAALSTTMSAYYLGRLSDRIGHRQVLVKAAMAAGFFYLLQFVVNNVWQLGILQVLVGIALGGIIPTISALLAGYTPEGTEGTAYGIDSSVISGSRTLAPMLGSAVVSSFLGLRGVFLISGVSILLVGLVALYYLPQGRETTPIKSQARST